MYPQSLQNLIDAFRRLPGVGEKTAERYALSVIDMNEQDIIAFSKALSDIRTHLKHCSICGNLCEDDTCSICSDPNRDNRTVFVVQSAKDILAMEKTGEYKGVYHVLNGLICPSKGIMPDDLNIDSLVKRAADADEIILGTSTTMDGETTSMYLHRLLQEQYPNLNITRIAHGLPSGGLLDYADEMTLAHALSDRRSMK
ncbi:MAG: recombination mediator RecR [Bulleidia sp.]|nr:recombination mediator RecR [Bulleidia sp.]MDY4808687.1 recombination mediator RecR [Bulleidia sp.]HAW13523.1 recombination protein RecR [Erysipelotrichaceae bacterium]